MVRALFCLHYQIRKHWHDLSPKEVTQPIEIMVMTSLRDREWCWISRKEILLLSDIYKKHGLMANWMLLVSDIYKKHGLMANWMWILEKEKTKGDGVRSKRGRLFMRLRLFLK
jgi:hypothetical protein